MGEFLSRLVSPTALLYAFLILAQVVTGTYLERDIEPPPSFTLIYALGFLWAVGWWLLNDSRGRGVGWAFDMGLFLYLPWPFVLPYYLLKTRGAKGLLLILGFLGVYAGALAAGVALSIVFFPSPG